MAEIIVSGSVADYPFHAPATGDKRDNELAMERLNEKIRGGVTRISTLEVDLNTLDATVSTNTSNIATNTSDIATNASNIATNTSNISTNTSSITTINNTLSTDLPLKVDEDSGFADIGTMNYSSSPYSAYPPSNWLGNVSTTGNTPSFNYSDWANYGWAAFFQYQFNLIRDDMDDMKTKVNAICAKIRG